jgi:hypothetical protein
MGHDQRSPGLHPRWLLVAAIAAVVAGIIAAVWLYQAVGG